MLGRCVELVAALSPSLFLGGREAAAFVVVVQASQRLRATVFDFQDVGRPEGAPPWRNVGNRIVALSCKTACGLRTVVFYPAF